MIRSSRYGAAARSQRDVTPIVPRTQLDPGMSGEKPHVAGSDFVNSSHQSGASPYCGLGFLGLQKLMHRPANIGFDGRAQLLLHGNLRAYVRQSGKNILDQCSDVAAMVTAAQLGFQRCLYCSASLMTEHDKQGVWRCASAYPRLPLTSGEITFPATRTMNNSPKAASKINSGATRESLHPKIVAQGC